MITIAMLTRPATRERDDDLPVGEAQHLAPLVVVANRNARLRQAGMQIDRVRHDGRADDADGEQQRLGVGDCGVDGVVGRRAPNRPAR